MLRATSSAVGSSTAAVSGPIVAFKTGTTPFHLIHRAVGVLPDKLFGWIEYGEFSDDGQGEQRTMWSIKC